MKIQYVGKMVGSYHHIIKINGELTQISVTLDDAQWFGVKMGNIEIFLGKTSKDELVNLAAKNVKYSAITDAIKIVKKLKVLLDAVKAKQ